MYRNISYFRNPKYQTQINSFNRYKDNIAKLKNPFLLTRRHLSSEKTLDLSGIYPPIITSFGEKGDISIEKLKTNLVKWKSISFRGLVVLGSTGESPLLGRAEKVAVVGTAAAATLPGKIIIAGSGCESTRATVELTAQVADAGAHAALVITPSAFFKGGRASEAALLDHYTKVADASCIPVLLYSVPANTGVDLGAPLVARLADHPNIVGLKDSGGDIAKIGLIIHLTKDKDFQVLAGSAGFLYPALCIGCVGGVVALANPLGEACCTLHGLFLRGKHEEARCLQHRLIGPNLMVTKQFGIAGVKAAMDLLGYHGGMCRPPLQSLSATEIEILKKEFHSSGFL